MVTTKYTLIEVKSSDKRIEREFIDLPKKIYKGNPNWVCPFDSSILAVFDPAKNKLFKDGEAALNIVGAMSKNDLWKKVEGAL